MPTPRLSNKKIRETPLKGEGTWVVALHYSQLSSIKKLARLAKNGDGEIRGWGDNDTLQVSDLNCRLDEKIRSKSYWVMGSLKHQVFTERTMRTLDN